jgi:hypothetical protein
VAVRQTPFGNTLTLQFAEAVVNGYQLGQLFSTDFLTINCASTDYAGHLTGVNSVEVEDVYLRLDRDLASFFAFLDEKTGKGNSLVILTTDHVAAHAEGFMADPKMPSGILEYSRIFIRCPTRIRTWTGRTKICSATITPSDSAK